MVPLYTILVVVAMTIPTSSVALYTGDGDCSLASHFHLLM